MMFKKNEIVTFNPKEAPTFIGFELIPLKYCAISNYYLVEIKTGDQFFVAGEKYNFKPEWLSDQHV